MGTDYRLAYGTHPTPEDGRCAMEWVSHLAGEPHSDEPRCVSPVLRAYCTSLNDSLDDGTRQHLRPYLARTIGTMHDGLDEQRSWMALDWLIRTYAPTWLAAAGLTGAAHQLADLAPVTDASYLPEALLELQAARCDAHAACPAPWRRSTGRMDPMGGGTSGRAGGRLGLRGRRGVGRGPGSRW